MSKSSKSQTLNAPKPLPAKAGTVIIGGGVVGLSIAYNLCLRGDTDVVIIEGSYLASGASGRNGGGIRQQWTTEFNIRLMRESIALCNSFAKDMGINIWFRQGGYLFLAREELTAERLEKAVSIQNECGLATKVLSAEGAQKIAPELNTKGILSACYNSEDGILFPWPFLWGYAERATEMGAALHTHTKVESIDRDGSGFHVHTSRGSIHAERVVNAAGAWSPSIASMVGVELPTHPVRHEICSSEPLKPFLKPMVSDLGSGLYFSQSMRGEIVGGIALPDEPHTLEMGSSLRFIRAYAKNITQIMPILGDIKVLRQWSGPYDASPDGHPVLGEPKEVPNFYLANGFVGHGFMLAPIVGKLYAEWLNGGNKHELFQTFTLDRFDPNSDHKLDIEDFNIG
jgi:sarcosine oxidase subunit beta